MMIQPRTIRISAKRNKTLRLKCYFHCLTFYSSIILISCISREAVIKRRPYIPYYIYNIGSHEIWTLLALQYILRCKNTKNIFTLQHFCKNF